MLSLNYLTKFHYFKNSPKIIIYHNAKILNELEEYFISILLKSDQFLVSHETDI